MVAFYVIVCEEVVWSLATACMENGRKNKGTGKKGLGGGGMELGERDGDGTEEMAEEFADDDGYHGGDVKQPGGKIGKAISHWRGGVKKQHQRLI